MERERASSRKKYEKCSECSLDHAENEMLATLSCWEICFTQKYENTETKKLLNALSGRPPLPAYSYSPFLSLFGLLVSLLLSCSKVFCVNCQSLISEDYDLFAFTSMHLPFIFAGNLDKRPRGDLYIFFYFFQSLLRALFYLAFRTCCTAHKRFEQVWGVSVDVYESSGIDVNCISFFEKSHLGTLSSAIFFSHFFPSNFLVSINALVWAWQTCLLVILHLAPVRSVRATDRHRRRRVNMAHFSFNIATRKLSSSFTHILSPCARCMFANLKCDSFKHFVCCTYK